MGYEEWYGKYVEGGEPVLNAEHQTAPALLSTGNSGGQNLTNHANSGMIESEVILRIRHDVIPSMNTNSIVQRQNIHRVGHTAYESRKQTLEAKGQYGPSYVTLSDKEILDLVSRYKGTGIIHLDKNGDWDFEETIVSNDRFVGVVYNNLTGENSLTTVFKIHYSKSGIHIVPDYPSKKVKWYAHK